MFSTVFAQATGGAAPVAGGGMGNMLIMMLGVFAIMYFFVMRPQMKEEKKRKALLKEIQKNDTVLTSGGFFGTVHLIKDNEVVLKLDDKGEAKIRVLKSAITQVIREESASDDKKEPSYRK